jgi:hypothetical protein
VYSPCCCSPILLRGGARKSCRRCKVLLLQSVIKPAASLLATAAAGGAAAYNLHLAAAVWHMLHPLHLLLQPHLFWCSTRRPSVFMPRSSRYDACASITPPRMLCMLRTCSSRQGRRARSHA